MKKMKAVKLLMGALLTMMLILNSVAISFAQDEEESSTPPPTATNIHELIQERYPNTISFPDFIRSLKDHPEKETIIAMIQGFLMQNFGIELDRETIEYLLENPEVILDNLQFTTAELESIRQLAANANREAGKEITEEDDAAIDESLPQTLKSEYQLPQVFDYSAIATTEIMLPPVTPDEVIEGVYLGFLRSDLISETAQKQNIIFSEVIERLSLNLHVDEVQTFTVIYNGTSYTRLNYFVDALLENGHELSSYVRHYVAPFIPLYAKGPDENIHPVASAVFQRTGLTDETGMEAIFPLMHSEFVFTITPTLETQGQAIQASIQYYQGIPKTGFYGNDCTDRAAWLGETTSDVLTPKEAKKALFLAGYLVDINKSIAEEQNLYFDGYAVMGVCNDAVAVVHTAIRNKPASFPLFMDDTELLPYINDRIRPLKKSKNPDDRFDRKIYRKLKKAVKKSPNDSELEYLAIDRVRTSFPWGEGAEPFFSTVDARRIIFADVEE